MCIHLTVFPTVSRQKKEKKHNHQWLCLLFFVSCKIIDDSSSVLKAYKLSDPQDFIDPWGKLLS